LNDGWYRRLPDGTAEPCDRREASLSDRRVALDVVGDARVSTVFLALDHSFGGGTPLLWETMIFGGKHDQFQERYSSEAQARAGHRRAVEMVIKEASDAAE
jgi:hypothetical protein